MSTRNGSDGLCPSDHHGTDRPRARVPGLFSAKHINGREPERCTYCVRCARAGYLFGFFRPDADELREAFDLWERRVSRAA